MRPTRVLTTGHVDDVDIRGGPQYSPGLKTSKRRINMKRMAALLLGSVIVSTLLVQAQAVTPFKLGTFQIQNRTFVGIVLRDSVVVDFAAASRAITPASKVALPTDMKDLIARYDSGL